MIDFLQEGSQVGEALAPERRVVAHPVDERREALGLGVIVNVAALGTFSDEASQVQ